MTAANQITSATDPVSASRTIIKTLCILATGALLLGLALAGPAEAATVSISSPSNVTMSTIPGTGGGISTGTVTWRVTSNALLGYTLTVAASGTPAMIQGSESIPDYPSSTPQTWSVAASSAAFGFSAQGPSTPTGTWGTPASGSGKYRGFAGTTPIQIANSTTSLLGGAEDTTVYLQAEVGSSRFQPSGTYTATITATATVGL